MLSEKKAEQLIIALFQSLLSLLSHNYKNSIPLTLIAFSYACIGVALLKISHGAERIKAMKTCTSHLILVAMFYLPIFSVYITALTTYLHPNTRIINSVLTQTIPPMLNPIIYSLKTEEVLQSIKVLYKRIKLNIAMENSINSIVKN